MIREWIPLKEWGKEFVFGHCIHLFSYKLTELHGKLCIIKWTWIENIFNFTALPETECDKTGTLRLDCSNNFYDLVPHLWSPPRALSDLFRFQSFEAPRVFDLPLAILHVGFSMPSSCPHKPLSLLSKGKICSFKGFGDFLFYVNLEVSGGFHLGWDYHPARAVHSWSQL